MCKKKHIKFTMEESAHKHMTYRMNDNLTLMSSKCLRYPRCYKLQTILQLNYIGLNKTKLNIYSPTDFRT